MVAYDDEFEDEFEDEEEEYEDDDEFEDDFEDEFADDFEDDEFASFGPVYIQGETSIGFDAYAMGASTLVVLLALFMMYTMVLGPVYDGLTPTPGTQYDGLGRRVVGTDGPEAISFAPAGVEILGVGRYDASDVDGDYDYCVLNAGLNQGIGIGLIYALNDPDGNPTKWMIVTEVEPEMSRADFIEKPAAGEEASLKIDKTYPDNPISREGQDLVWERETIANLLVLLDDGWQDRGVTAEEQVDALERFASLGVPSRTGQPMFRLVDIPSFNGDDPTTRARAQLAAFDRLRGMSPKAAADRLREIATEKNFQMVDRQDTGWNSPIKVPRTLTVPLPAPMSPVLRKSLVMEALNLAESDLVRRMPAQFPDLNPEWNIISHLGVGRGDVTGPDNELISSPGQSEGGALYSVGRPKDDVTAFLAPAEDQIVIRTVLDILASTIAEEQSR